MAFRLRSPGPVRSLSDLLPRAWTGLEVRLSASPLGRYVLAGLRRPQSQLFVTLAPRFATTAAGAVASTVIVFFAGLFFAFHPSTYLDGALKLFPPRTRPRLAAAADACGEALRRWLIAQLASMLLVGVSVSLGLWLAGVSSPLALGASPGSGNSCRWWVRSPPPSPDS